MEAQIARMREMAGVLHALADACEGDHRPDCPNVEGLEGNDAGNLRIPPYLPPRSVNP